MIIYVMSYQIVANVSDKLSILSSCHSGFGRCGADEREPEVAVIDAQIPVDVKIQAVIKKDNLEVVR